MLCTLIGAIILSINIQVGLNMHLYDDIEDASSSLQGSTSSFNVHTRMHILCYCPAFQNSPFPRGWSGATKIFQVRVGDFQLHLTRIFRCDLT